MSKTKEYARTMKGGGAFTRQDIELLYQNPEVACSYDQERFQSYAGRLRNKLENDAVWTLIAPEKHDKILDLATGTGRFAVELKKRFPESNITGIDRSPAMLKEARSKSSNLQFIEMDSFNTEFKNGVFDVITTILFIRHFDCDVRRNAYAEIHRLLTPNGVLVMDVANYEYHKNLIEDRPVFDEIYTKKKFCGEMAENGFRVERFLGIPVRTRGFRRILSFNRNEETRLRMECFLNRMFWKFRYSTRLPHGWIVKCRKIS